MVVLESRGSLPQHDCRPYGKNSMLRFESCHHTPRNCPKLGEKTGKDPPLALSKGARPCQRPDANTEPPKLWGNTFLLFKPLSLWCFVMALHANRHGGRRGRTDKGKSGSRMKVSRRPREQPVCSGVGSRRLQ